MKRKVIIAAAFFAVCLLSAFAGYRAAVSKKPPELPQQTEKTVSGAAKEDEAEKKEPHYLAKIEDGQLLIYELPENRIYESMKAEALNFPEQQLPELYRGIFFDTLPEVYEFLENCMS